MQGMFELLQIVQDLKVHLEWQKESGWPAVPIDSELGPYTISAPAPKRRARSQNRPHPNQMNPSQRDASFQAPQGFQQTPHRPTGQGQHTQNSAGSAFQKPQQARDIRPPEPSTQRPLSSGLPSLGPQESERRNQKTQKGPKDEHNQPLQNRRVQESPPAPARPSAPLKRVSAKGLPSLRMDWLNPQSTQKDPRFALDRLRQESIGCNRCSLTRDRTQVIFGRGTPDTRLVLAGGFPAREEDFEAMPFVGEEGELLERMLRSIGIPMKRTYMLHLVKCWNRSVRQPKQTETEACSYYWLQQLEAIQPDFIVSFGTFAAKVLLNVPLQESQGLREKYIGKWFPVTLPGEGKTIQLLTMHDLGFVLRHPEHKKGAWHALRSLKERLHYSSKSVQKGD